MSKRYSFPSSAAVFDWISSFPNVERGRSPGGPLQSASFDLHRMRLLAELAGNPERSAESIHIAGSKGKGSVTGMIASMLEAAGLKAARYMSPHVTDYRERICLGNNFFDESLYIDGGNELKTLLTEVKKGNTAFASAFAAGGEPTVFELLTLYFFLCARRAGAGYMAVETGLGGRLDSTNIVDPLISIITGIELEHTDYLGNTLTAIAGEKAGIIKKRKPLALAEQSPEVLDVFREKAAEMDAPLYYFPDYVRIENTKVHREGTNFTLVFRRPGFFDAPLDLFIPIPGTIQAKNAGLAVLSLKIACPSITTEAIRRGLAGFRLPARFERISGSPPLVIDGAHTAHSVELAVHTFTDLYGTGGICIFGCAADKNVESMAEIILPCFSHIIITTPGSFKISYPETVCGIFKKAALSLPEIKEEYLPDIYFVPETNKAIHHAILLGRELSKPVLGTGSNYLAAEIRKSHV